MSFQKEIEKEYKIKFNNAFGNEAYGDFGWFKLYFKITTQRAILTASIHDDNPFIGTICKTIETRSPDFETFRKLYLHFPFDILKKLYNSENKNNVLLSEDEFLKLTKTETPFQTEKFYQPNTIKEIRNLYSSGGLLFQRTSDGIKYYFGQITTSSSGQILKPLFIRRLRAFPKDCTLEEFFTKDNKNWDKLHAVW